MLEPALADGGLKTSQKRGGPIPARCRRAGPPTPGARPKTAAARSSSSRTRFSLEALQDLAAGTTINVGVIDGGTTANVVPAHASAEIDVRVASASGGSPDRIGPSRRSRPIKPDIRVTVSGCVQQAADGANSGRRRLCSSRPGHIGKKLGLDLTEGSTGGGSDGNFTAALGIPTLDGLGARGGGAHADNEHIVIDSLSERAALLAALLLELQMD